ncbi:unnamed protein product [Calypogeia fissa]
MKINCSTTLGTASVTGWEIETVYTQHWLWKCSTTLGTDLEIETVGGLQPCPPCWLLNYTLHIRGMIH